MTRRGKLLLSASGLGAVLSLVGIPFLAGLELETGPMLEAVVPPCTPLRVKVGHARGGYWCPHPDHEVTEHWSDDNTALHLACDCPTPTYDNGAYLVKK